MPYRALSNQRPNKRFATDAMILPLIFGRSRRAGTIDALYGMIVAQARLPAFYRDYHVPDTVNGRFDLIVVHLALLLRRTGAGGDASLGRLGQQVFDAFCLDMDENMREMGIGDLSVSKHMQNVGSAFYGRYQAYETALAGDDGPLESALARNVYGRENADGAARLAAYIREAAGALAQQDDDALAGGTVTFPDPAAVKA